MSFRRRVVIAVATLVALLFGPAFIYGLLGAEDVPDNISGISYVLAGFFVIGCLIYFAVSLAFHHNKE